MKGVQQNGIDDHYCSGTGLSKAFKYFYPQSCDGNEVSTEGLYLNKKNITLMVCIEKEREEEILDYIRQSCTERMEERQVCEYNGMTMVDVTKGVKVGGAIVFFLDVDRMMKY